MKTRFLACVLAALLVGPATLTVHGVERPLRQVDHISIGVAEPEALLTWLTTELGLPVAWPLAPFGNVMSGGVSVGNLNIEVMRRPSRPAATFLGLAFEPAPLDTALTDLRARGVAIGATERSPLFPLPDGEAVQWNSVVLPAVSVPDTWAILCEYVQPRAAVTRSRMTAALEGRRGGPLGIVGAAEIVLGGGGDAGYVSAWRALLQSEATGRLSWNPGAGPRVTIEPAETKGLRRLVLRVRSVAQARRVLDSRGAGGSGSDRELQLPPARTSGLDIRLIESD